MYMCFVETPGGMIPAGLTQDKATAVGKIILLMQDELASLADDQDFEITFGSEQDANSRGASNGFSFEGSLHCAGVNITIDGYALYVGKDGDA